MSNLHEFWAYVAGWEAWFAGVSLFDNPHGRYGADSKAWVDGWLDATE